MRARILPPTPENVAIAAQAIRQGEVVGIPTETVYGLAGAALQPEALTRIFDTKERPTFDPLIVHVGFGAKGVYALERQELIDGKKLSAAARDRAEALIQAFWPGPLTLVLPKHEKVPDLSTSGLPTVALRMPAHRVAQMLIAASGVPVAAPSANRFGRISPTTAQAVADELGDRIDWILDGGPCEVGVESTVIRVESDGALTMLRPGGLARSRIEEVTGCAVEIAPSTSRPGSDTSRPGHREQSAQVAQPAPGMLESHYAPVKPLYLLPRPIGELTLADWELIAGRVREESGLRDGSLERVPASAGFLLRRCADPVAAQSLAREKLIAAGIDLRGDGTRSGSGRDAGAVTILALSRDGGAPEAARRLFGGLRELDASDARVLFAEPCPTDTGLNHAIADRLTRASRGLI
jgi:L-threonylcarbamoyladenylate synthase